MARLRHEERGMFANMALFLVIFIILQFNFRCKFVDHWKGRINAQRKIWFVCVQSPNNQSSNFLGSNHLQWYQGFYVSISMCRLVCWPQVGRAGARLPANTGYYTGVRPLKFSLYHNRSTLICVIFLFVLIR
jgi:hypothetical protein